MNRQEFQALSTLHATPTSTLPGALTNKAARTLLYGYTCDRSTWHVYLDEYGVMHKVVYDSNKLLKLHCAGEIQDAELMPDKRLYPEACDAEACALLIRAGRSLPFTTYTDTKRPANPYIGMPAQDLVATTCISMRTVLELAKTTPEGLPALVAYDKGFLSALSQEGLHDLQAAILAVAPRPQLSDRAAAAVGLLLSTAAREAGLATSTSTFMGAYEAPNVLYIPKGTEAQLATAAGALASSFKNYPVDLTHHDTPVRFETAEAVVREQLGIPEHPGPRIDISDVITSGRVLLVRLGAPLEQKYLVEGCEIREVSAKDGTAVSLAYKNGQLKHAFFNQGPEQLVGFAMFGPALRLTEDLLKDRGTMAVLAA